MFRNIAVGISGGVDSAVAAHLLKQRGFNVIGVFMKNWDEFDEQGHCSGERDLLDAIHTCEKLDIELKQVNYVKSYWTSVFMNFLEDYQQGLTPNPDILCNKHIKFDLFHKHALETLKCDALATGHYARNSFGNFLEHYDEHDDAQLLIPHDTFKDQTFFLAGIDHKRLRHTMFPLGDLLKAQVKLLAERCGLNRIAMKKESTGICFVGSRNFKEFIREYVHTNPGNFTDIDTGQVVGQHDGLHQWTIGQRCRLASYRLPYYVAHKDVANNIIYVASGHDHPVLFSEYIHTSTPNWLCSDPFKNNDNNAATLRCRFRFQHTKPLVDCIIQRIQDGNLHITLDEPLRAITPGQYAVFYNENQCLGSARILCSMRTNDKYDKQYNTI